MGLNDFLDDMSTTPKARRPINAGLLEILEERQKKILSHLPKFAKLTVLIALGGFIVTAIIQWLTDTLPQDRYGLVSITQPTLGTIIAFFLSLFSILVMWVFVIWSLSFIPFIAYHAYKSSQQSAMPVGTKAFRWVQLYSATFLPMAIFAVTWSSTTASRSNIQLQITSLTETLFVILGATTVSFILWGMDRLIPKRLVAIRLSLLSSMLYASLFLTYGLGYSLASYSTLFGILIYLTFGSAQIEEMGRRIVTYDIDPKVADKLNEIAAKRQELRSTHDEIRAKEMEGETEKQKHQQQLKTAQIENEARLDEQIAGIQTAKTNFNQQTNETLLKMFQQKHHLFSTMYEILSQELSNRMDAEVPKKIEELKTSAKEYSPKELYHNMSQIMKKINSGLEGLPESLEELRSQMLQAAKEMEDQTRLLAGGSANDNKDNKAE